MFFFVFISFCKNGIFKMNDKKDFFADVILRFVVLGKIYEPFY